MKEKLLLTLILILSVVILGSSSSVAKEGNYAIRFQGQEVSEDRYVKWYSVVSLSDARTNPAGFDFKDTSLTVEAWIKPEDTKNGVVIAGGNLSARVTTDAFILYLWKGASPHAPEGCHNTDELSCVKFAIKSKDVWYAATAHTPKDLTNEWHHVAGVLDISSGTLTVYVDGVPLKGADDNHPNPKTGVPAIADSGMVFIGANQCVVPEATIGHERKNHETHPGVKHWFKGTIDEVRLWREARTQGQIQKCMKQEIGSGECGITDKLATYLKFNEGKGSSIWDHTGNGNNASARYYQKAQKTEMYKDHSKRIGYHTQVKDHESLEILDSPHWVEGFPSK